MTSRECTECGHEMAANASSCGFCGAPKLHKSVLARPGAETFAKCGALVLLLYVAWHLASQLA
jgi:hypothetical protein